MIKLISLLKEVLLEGGNVFGTTAPIKKEDIEPTLEKFSDELGRIFPAKAKTFKSFQTLGSVGKKPVSGDIDLGYDAKNLFPDGKTPDFKGWGVDKAAFDERVAAIQKRARTATPEQIQLRAMVDLIGNKINDNSDIIRVDLKQSGAGSIFCETGQYDEAGEELGKTVQTDINIGNLDWLKFSYYSSTYEGNVKGLHRTQLLVALFGNKGYTFRHGQGVINKDTREIEAKTPKEALALLNKLYGTNITQDTLEDYHKVMEYMRKNLSKEDFNSVADIYLKILDSTRADIPTDLQDYWIENQDRLGLKGKFLPDESALIKYKKEA
jgi:tetratricopeptide (TPR) repeat protein